MHYSLCGDGHRREYADGGPIPHQAMKRRRKHEVMVPEMGADPY